MESQEHVVRIRRIIAAPAASGTFAGRLVSAVLAIAIIVLALVLIVPLIVIGLIAAVALFVIGTAKAMFARAKADNGMLDGRRNVRVIRRD